MSLAQLHYTSAPPGPDGSGFRFTAVSAGVPQGVLREAEQLIGYEPPRDLPARPDAEQLKSFPKAFSCSELSDGGRLLSRSVYTGADYSGRWGNFHAHAVHLPAGTRLPDGALPITTWESPRWSDSTPPGGRPEPIERFEPSGLLRRDGLIAFAASRADRLAAFFADLRAWLEDPEAAAQIVLVEHDSADVAQWIALACTVLPREQAHRLTFTTYTRRPQQARQQIIGVLPSSEPVSHGHRHRVHDCTGAARPEHEPEPVTDAWAHVCARIWCAGRPDLFRDASAQAGPLAVAALVAGVEPGTQGRTSAARWAVDHADRLSDEELTALVGALAEGAAGQPAPASGPGEDEAAALAALLARLEGQVPTVVTAPLAARVLASAVRGRGPIPALRAGSLTAEAQDALARDLAPALRAGIADEREPAAGRPLALLRIADLLDVDCQDLLPDLAGRLARGLVAEPSADSAGPGGLGAPGDPLGRVPEGTAGQATAHHPADGTGRYPGGGAGHHLGGGAARHPGGVQGGAPAGGGITAGRLGHASHERVDRTTAHRLDPAPHERGDRPPHSRLPSTPSDRIDRPPYDRLDRTSYDALDRTRSEGLDRTPYDALDGTPYDRLDRTSALGSGLTPAPAQRPAPAPSHRADSPVAGGHGQPGSPCPPALLDAVHDHPALRIALFGALDALAAADPDGAARRLAGAGLPVELQPGFPHLRMCVAATRADRPGGTGGGDRLARFHDVVRAAGVSPHADTAVLRTALGLVWPGELPTGQEASLLLNQLGSDIHRAAGTLDLLVESALAAPADDPGIPALASDLLRCFPTELRPGQRAALLLLEFAGLLGTEGEGEDWVGRALALRDGAAEPVPETVIERVFRSLAWRLVESAPESELYALARSGEPGLLAAYERAARSARVGDRLRTVPSYVAVCFCAWSAYPGTHPAWDETRTALLGKVLRPVVRALPAEDVAGVEEALGQAGRGKLDAFRTWNRPGALGRLAGRLSGRGRRTGPPAAWPGDVEPPTEGRRR